MLGLFLLGAGGTGIELLLMEHVEDLWQWTPIVLLGAGIVAGAALALRRSAGSVRVFRGLMWLYMPAGAVGMYLHLKSNLEFEREINAAVAGGELAMKVLMGAMPALSPGHMMGLGLLGLLAIMRTASSDPERHP